MNYRKHGLEALTISVLGVMAIGVSGAQASGKLLVEGRSGPFSEWFEAKLSNALEGRLLILGLNMEIFCHDASSTLNALSDDGHGSFVILFESCLAQGLSGGKLLGAVCEIPDITANGLALIILHSGNSALTTSQHEFPATGKPYILFSMHGNLIFSKVLNHTECALPENANVKGCVVAAVVTEGDQVTHSITTKGMLSLFGCKLNYGANEAHLDGDALVSLWGGARKWGVE